MTIINGFNLGYYWPIVGPQMTQYVPGPVLKNGTNILAICEFDHAPSDLTGMTPPIAAFQWAQLLQEDCVACVSTLHHQGQGNTR